MKIKHILIGLVAVVVIAVIAVVICLESIVKTAVHKYGSEVVGTDVRLQGFSLNLLKGTASVEGLTVANPEKYHSPYLFNLGGISVKIDTKSVLTDTIIIDDITVSKPVITYEMLSLNQNNIKQIQENVTKNTAKTASASATKEKAASEEEKPAAPGKKVIIRKLTIAEGELQAVTTLQGKDNTIQVKLPSIVLNDIGADKSGKGQSIAASISKIMSKILNTATETVVKSNLSDLKKVAKENLDNAVDSVKDKVKNLGIFGKK